MRKDKDAALSLRREGKSYKDIAHLLNIPKSTLSDWFSDIDWSQAVKRNLIEKTKNFHVAVLKNLAKVRGKVLDNLYERSKAEAISEFQILKSNPLFIATLMIYWGEGDKRSRYRCCVSNCEPDMLRLFLLFLERICGVEKSKIKAWILAYPDINQAEAMEFWSEKIGVPKQNFTKTAVILGKSTKRNLPHGVCYIVYGSAYLKIKILLWIKLLSSEIIQYSK